MVLHSFIFTIAPISSVLQINTLLKVTDASVRFDLKNKEN